MLLKNKSIRLLGLGLSLVFLWSCRDKVSFPGFNSPAWKADAHACQSVRSKMIPELEKIRMDFRGLSTRAVIEVLGKPDSEGLLANNERIYYYYIQAGSQCQEKRKLSSANKLMVRFNALEKVSEINFEQPIR